MQPGRKREARPQQRQCSGSVCERIGAALGTVIELFEGNGCAGLELLGVIPVERPQFGFRRMGATPGVLEEERHFLRQPPPNDDVVVVQTQRDRFAREQQLVHVLGDQRPHFMLGRRVPALRGPGSGKPRHLVPADSDLLFGRRSGTVRGAVHPCIGAEQGRSGQEEMKQGFPCGAPADAAHHPPRTQCQH